MRMVFMPKKRNLNKELKSVRQKVEAKGLTEKDVEIEIIAHRSKKYKKDHIGKGLF